MARAVLSVVGSLVVSIVAFAPAAAPSLGAVVPGADRSMAQTVDPVIAAAGDIACAPTDPNYNGGAGNASNCRMGATSDLLAGGGLAAVLGLGDMQYEQGELANFNASYDPSWGRVKSITRPAPGNHEYYTTGAAGYYSYFGAAAGDPAKGYYSFNIGAWHLIALNSNCAAVGGCGAGSPQEQWLRADLAANPVACTLAYWHHPRFSSGNHGDNAAYDAFWKALHAAGADVVLAGHDHTYERFAPQTPAAVADPAFGIREFVVGTGGKSLYGFPTIRANSQLRANTAYGVLKLTLHAASYDWQFVTTGGSSLDTGTTSCHGVPGSAPPDAQAPVQPTVTDPSAPTSVRSNTYTLRGTAEAGSTVRVWLDSDNDGTKDSSVAESSQQLTSSETTFAVSVSLRERVNNFLVTATDAAGNESPSSDVPTITNTRRRK